MPLFGENHTGEKRVAGHKHDEKRKDPKPQSIRPPRNKDPLKRAFGNVGVAH